MAFQFDAVWDSIVSCSGQTFATQTAQVFSYDVREDALILRRSDVVLSKKDIEAAYFSGASSGKENGRGPAAYINALLRDSRIRA